MPTSISKAGDADGWYRAFGVLYGDVLVVVTTKSSAPDVVSGLLPETAPH